MLRAAKQDSSCFCEIYALKRNELIHSYFPKKEAAEFYVTNLEYVYQDTFCYYYGLDRTIYQLLPGEKKVRYRFDMGKYNRLQTMIDFYEEQKSGVLHEYLSLSMCNETDRYVIGKYDFKAKEYIFIYDKRTGITGNFRRIDNDLLKTGQKTKCLKVTGLAKGDFISTWSTDNWSIADVSVSSDGTCNITAGKTTGKTRIHIYLNSGYEKSVTVKVQKTAVKTTKIKGVPKTLKLKKNQKYSLKPVLKPVTSKEKITYKSSSSKVVKVDSKGRITAKKKGTAVITVKAGKKTVKCKVTVK